MKKLMIGLPLAVLMLMLSLTVVSAGVDFEDPKLCVDGQWLLVYAAPPSAVAVSLPENTRYGDQKAGGCKDPGPAVPLITNVKVRGDNHAMRIVVDGKFASPTVTATYGKAVQVEKNNGHEKIEFRFGLRGRGD